jgi:adenine-specific DNA-methyltransferase
MPSLHWIWKDKVINHHLEVPYRILDKKYTIGDTESSENKIIHGDNLDALKSLLPEYEWRVKCIYIDPPYNTGNEWWIYNDNVSDPKLKKWLNQVVGKEWEDLTRHDKWLCMMYPRLKLLHKLLAPDGAIFISIDDNEQANLRLMMDEIFGGNNFVTNVIWQKRYTRSNNTDWFTTVVEHIVVYWKTVAFKPNLIAKWEEANARYKNLDNDPRWPWKAIPFLNPLSPEERPNLVYDIIQPNTLEVLQPKLKAWRTSKDVYESYAKENRIYWWKDWKSKNPTIKRFLSEVREVMPPINFWDYQFAGHTDKANSELKAIFWDKSFPTPKPSQLIERVIEVATNPWDIILDSFAWSGTTAHAVLNMNKRDGGDRKFILIETEDYAETITAERVKRVIKWYGKIEWTGGDFEYLTLGSPLMTPDGLLSSEASLSDIRAYVCYTETGSQMLATPLVDHPYWLARSEDRDHYFYYERDSFMVLDRGFLSTITVSQPYYTIWADRCDIPLSLMKKQGITFRKIPRDIRNI